jgi:hypothetical protein
MQTVPAAATTTSETPNTTTPPVTPKKRAARGLFNKAQMSAVDLCALVFTAGSKQAFALLLAVAGINAAVLAVFNAAIKAVQARMSKAIGLTADLRTATVEERAARRLLLGKINGIKASAKRKYARTAPDQLADYFVGKPMNNSRAMLVQSSASILLKLATDTLPGVTQEIIDALQQAHDDYVAANGMQVDLQSQATQERIGIAADVRALTTQRLNVQLAADGIWLPTDKTSAPIRKEFQLPINRSIIVRKLNSTGTGTGTVPPLSFSPADGATNVPTIGAQISFDGPSGNLYFGTVSGQLTQEVISAQSPVDINVQLGAVQPGTTYYWRLDVGGVQGVEHSFTTAP